MGETPYHRRRACGAAIERYKLVVLFGVKYTTLNLALRSKSEEEQCLGRSRIIFPIGDEYMGKTCNLVQ
jgi:hypothetical protein